MNHWQKEFERKIAEEEEQWRTALRYVFTWFDLGNDQALVAVCGYSGKVAKTSSSLFVALIVNDCRIIPNKSCEESRRCLALSCPLNHTTETTLRAELKKRPPKGWETASDKLTKRVKRLLAEEAKPTLGKMESPETMSVFTSRSPLKPRQRWRILERDHFRCCACGRTNSDGITLHIDHIVPVSKRGSNDDDNLQTLCQECNLGKGTATRKVP